MLGRKTPGKEGPWGREDPGGILERGEWGVGERILPLGLRGFREGEDPWG